MRRHRSDSRDAVAGRRAIVASHLVFHGYGYWLANDPRGSGSESVRKDALRDLGPVHFGRKRAQPSREELRAFYQEANKRLEFKPLWFRRSYREVIAQAVARVIEDRGYTVWAFAACSNHGHAVVRSHRDRSEVIWQHLADAARDALRRIPGVPPRHPVWSHRPYKVFKYTPEDVYDAIGYVEDNPEKEGLPRQTYAFVKPCPYRSDSYVARPAR